MSGALGQMILLEPLKRDGILFGITTERDSADTNHKPLAEIERLFSIVEVLKRGIFI